MRPIFIYLLYVRKVSSPFFLGLVIFAERIEKKNMDHITQYIKVIKAFLSLDLKLTLFLNSSSGVQINNI